MKTAKSLDKLAAEVERRARARRDLVAPVENLEVRVADAEGTPELRLSLTNGKNETFGITPHAHSQLAEYACIPVAEYRQMHEGAPELLAEFVNRSMRSKAKDRRMLRTLDGPIRDLVTSALDEARFEAVARMLTLAASNPMESDAVDVLEHVGERFGLDEGEKQSVLHHLIKGRDLTRYGLHAAITRASADVGDYDRATELERLGGRVIRLSLLEWNAISQGAPRMFRVRRRAAS